MKKSIALILALFTLIFSFAGCDEKGKTEKTKAMSITISLDLRQVRSTILFSAYQ